MDEGSSGYRHPLFVGFPRRDCVAPRNDDEKVLNLSGIGIDDDFFALGGDSIKVIMLQPGKLAKTVEIDASLEGMQQAVGGGLIEPVYIFDEEVCLVCNEEGKINGMRPNRALYDEGHEMIDIICGPAFICDCSGESFGSLSEDQIKRYGNQFRKPERFFRTEDGIVAVPFTPDREQSR